ncbi:DUF2169 family type VI secretion system accessory protein [Phyllobacterium myrsinacearum]|uniref:DUF2169 domain-containing protein n=1 Tax=Phyllobacterium myrsinacearum TaxID=28101 RepID=A0A839ERY4_9HYPH|nr:DUF2169 domain-containing protein [Phyllobacterium myrsinacearum]MBA8880958.1 hypothetical protein [Phyllobacterium myrsinacearum]
MWDVNNRTPFSEQGYFVRDRHGAEHWVVAVRATFAVQRDGLVALADAQGPVRLAPTYRKDDAAELTAETDISPFRPQTDFTVQGFACAPDMAAVRRLPIRVSVNSLHKNAVVFGQRHLKVSRNGAAVSEPDEFGGIALTWKNSLGGADPFDRREDAEPLSNNPIGTGWTAAWGKLPLGSEMALPLIEDPKNLIRYDRPLPKPHGFGPLQPAWEPRRSHAGTYDEKWRATKAPLLPDDFSDRFYQAASQDQILDLKGGETVEAEGLHPDGIFSFRLPQIVLRATTWIGQSAVETRFRLIAVSLNAKDKMVDMVWNTTVPCNGRDTAIRNCSVIVKQMAGVA